MEAISWSSSCKVHKVAHLTRVPFLVTRSHSSFQICGDFRREKLLLHRRRKPGRVYCEREEGVDDQVLRNEALSVVVKSLVTAGVKEDDAVRISLKCPRFVQRIVGKRGSEADEIVQWANLSVGAEEERCGDGDGGELSGLERWSVVLEFVGVSAQATARISRVLSESSLPAFLKKVEFLEESLKTLQLDGEVFGRKVHQMMRRLSVATDEDLQQTLSFFEKMDAQRGGIGLLTSAHYATARLVEGFPQIFLRDLDTELRSVLAFLETAGVAPESLGRVLLQFPPVLLADPDRDLQPRLRTLTKVGVRAMDLGRMIVRYPWLLSRTAQNNVGGIVDFLLSVKVLKRDIDSSITGCPQLLGCSSDRTLMPMIERMNVLGVKSKRLGYVVAASPQLLVRSPDEFNEVVNFLLKVGVMETDLGGMLKRHPGVFASDVETVLEPKVQFLRDLGMKEDVLFRILRFYPEILTMRIEESLKPRVKYFQDLKFHNKAICSMICRFPPLLSYNPEPVLQPKIDFLVNSMGRQIFEVIEYPRYFSYSLEKKIKPRARVINRFKVKCTLKEMLALNDDQFAAKFLGVGSMLVPPK